MSPFSSVSFIISKPADSRGSLLPRVTPPLPNPSKVPGKYAKSSGSDESKDCISTLSCFIPPSAATGMIDSLLVPFALPLVSPAVNALNSDSDIKPENDTNPPPLSRVPK